MKHILHLNDFGYSEPIKYTEIISITNPQIDIESGYWKPLEIKLKNTDVFKSLISNQIERQAYFFANNIDDSTLTYKFGMKLLINSKVETFNSIAYHPGKEIMFEECWLAHDFIEELDMILLLVSFKNAYIKGKKSCQNC